MREKHALVRYLFQLGLLEKLPHDSLYEKRAEGVLRVLAKEGLLDETQAIAALSSALKLPFYDLRDPEITERLSLKDYAHLLQPSMCWKHKVVPLYEEHGQIVSAFANPLDEEAKGIFEFTLGKPIQVVIAKELQIQRILDSHLPSKKTHYDQLPEDRKSPGYIEVLSPLETDSKKAAADSQSPPIVRLCNKILTDAIRENATDIHLEPSALGLDIRFRIDGVMTHVFEIPKRLQSALTSRYKLLAAMDIAEHRRPQDGRLQLRVAGESIDLRASSIPTPYGEKLVLRILQASRIALTFDGLGITGDFQSQLSSLLHSRGKIILVTGPTGSGKTTTLYTCLEHLKDGTKNIQTVEDPIEYSLPEINQIQVNPAIEVTFASALRSVLRQDPDIIMIGEIRDAETARIAFQAAQTGHLVISTLHTNDAPSSVTRLRDLGIEPFILASTLAGVLAQRLVRKICPDCISELDQSDIALGKGLLAHCAVELNIDQLRKGTGCENCHYTGYRGRFGLYSLLEISAKVAEAIYHSRPLSELLQKAEQNRYQSLQVAAVKALQEGKTTLTEVIPYLKDELFLDSSESQSRTATPATPVERAEAAPSIPAEESSEEIRRDKVILVEDDEGIRNILAQVLERDMFEVIEAENGKEALDLLFKHKPDIVLCDLMMPIMDGREFLKKIKGHKHTKHIPVVILTAADSEGNEVDLLELGAEDFVSKAQSSKILLTRVRRAMQT